MFDFDRSLILIVGAQRSGTSWLQRMLASHPLIASGQESHLFAGYLSVWWERWQEEQQRRTDGGRTVGLGCHLNEEEILEEMRGLARRSLSRVRYLKPAAEVIIEKTPDHGLHLPLIHRLFPDATIIHVLRDGRDVVDSMLAMQKTAWGRADFPETTEEAITRWMHSVRTIMRDQKLFRRKLEIRHENLIENGSKSLSKVFDFLGFPLSEAESESIFERWRLANCIANSVEEALVIPQRLRGGHKLEPKGFYRSVRSGAWQESLTLSQQQTIMEHAGSLLEELGYDAKPRLEPADEPRASEMVSVASRDDAIFRQPKSLEVAKSTNAQMLPRERLYLYATVFALAPERTLEIGVCEGGSTRIIASALNDLGGGTLISVDPYLQISDELREKLQHRVTFLEHASPGILVEAERLAGGKFKFVLVDGDHSRNGVIEDLQGVVEVTAPGAFVLLHDAYSQPVAAGIDEVLNSGLHYTDCGMVSETCHPMRQDGQLYNWGGFRLLIRK